MPPQEGQRVGPEEGRDARGDGEQVATSGPQHRHGAEQAMQRTVLHAAPELLEPLQPVGGLVAGDQAGIDGADRGADHPVRLDAGLVQRLVDADLIGAQRPAALEDQDVLAELFRGPAQAARRIGRDSLFCDGRSRRSRPLEFADHRLIGDCLRLKDLRCDVFHHGILLNGPSSRRRRAGRRR